MAEQSISASLLQRTPSSIVIDRLYVEGGMHVIGGLSMRINQREQPTQLMRDVDYPSLLKWVAVQAMVFFDTTERRSWLVDGASALLHLVRNSLHRDKEDEESPYEWVFDENALKDTWVGCNRRQEALNTLKDSDNLNLKVYMVERSEQDGKFLERYSILRDRVLKILHSLEILIETQVRATTKGEVKTLQTLDRRKFVTGYDILDVIEPLEPISTRITYFDTWGDGWMDLLPSLGATTIFGRGFGDLIRPMDLKSVCSSWETIPTSKDYMRVTVSTLKMLHDKRLQRLHPTSNAGELTSKLLWASTCQPFEICRCLEGHTLMEQEHVDPRQFLLTSKQGWKPSLRPKDSIAIDFGILKDTGAVVFANSGILGRKIGVKGDEHVNDDMDTQHLNSITSHPTTSFSAIHSGSSNLTDTRSISTNTTLCTPSSTGTTNEKDSVGGGHKGKGKGKIGRLMSMFARR
ncbi:hypothetical protein GQ44DRAFT_613201 [Phaeosphaeriaceae sp. PMI808]|nr:hypothetical protein GQ44DRAFT_613201 [Phaeosphaeriaceae sp. PMI808]